MANSEERISRIFQILEKDLGWEWRKLTKQTGAAEFENIRRELFADLRPEIYCLARIMPNKEKVIAIRNGGVRMCLFRSSDILASTNKEDDSHLATERDARLFLNFAAREWMQTN